MDVANSLLRVTPEDVGIASLGIKGFLDAAAREGIELHSLMLLRHGRVAAEGWWAPYAPEYPHMLYSLSKSFTSTAAGLAIAEGYFQLDDPVLEHFSDCAPKRPDENLKAMRVRDLLCMGTGHETEPGPSTGRNWEKAFLSHPVVHRPGNHFLYNSMATFMVSSLIQRKTGVGLAEYLGPRLFKPLGIEEPLWEENGDGIACGGWGLNLKTEDIARFGQMLLQEGAWRGEQLVPRSWVRLMTAWQIDNSRGGEKDWAQGYGFQFWRCRNDLYRGDGMWGQFCVVMPKQDAVLAVTSGTHNLQGVLDCAFEHIVPAISSLDSLPPDPVASTGLAQRLAGLAIEQLAAGKGKVASELLGVRFAIGEGEEKVRVRLDPCEGGLKVELRVERTSHLRAGFDKPLQGTYYDQGGRKFTAFSKASIQKGGGVLLHVQLPQTPYRREIELVKDKAGIKGRTRQHPEGVALADTEWKPVAVE